MKEKLTYEQKKRIRDKQNRNAEITRRFIEKEKLIKNALKERVITALTIAPALSVMLISSAYQLLGSSLYGIKNGPMIAIGWLSIIAVLGSIALAVVHKRAFTSTVLALLFGAAFFCYLSFALNGTTDIMADGFFEMLMLALSIPIWSYMSVSMSFANPPYVPSLIIAGVLTALSIAASVYIIRKKKRDEKFER